MDLQRAAANTLTLWTKNRTEPLPPPVVDPEARGLAHQHWVLLSIVNDCVEGEKAHRWLGWAQGYLAAVGELTLVDAKYANALA